MLVPTFEIYICLWLKILWLSIISPRKQSTCSAEEKFISTLVIEGHVYCITGETIEIFLRNLTFSTIKQPTFQQLMEANGNQIKKNCWTLKVFFWVQLNYLENFFAFSFIWVHIVLRKNFVFAIGYYSRCRNS